MAERHFLLGDLVRHKQHGGSGTVKMFSSDYSGTCLVEWHGTDRTICARDDLELAEPPPAHQRAAQAIRIAAAAVRQFMQHDDDCPGRVMQPCVCGKVAAWRALDDSIDAYQPAPDGVVEALRELVDGLVEAEAWTCNGKPAPALQYAIDLLKAHDAAHDRAEPGRERE